MVYMLIHRRIKRPLPLSLFLNVPHSTPNPTHPLWSVTEFRPMKTASVLRAQLRVLSSTL